MNIYNTAFVYNKLGLAQAKGVVFLVIIAAITLSQLITFKKKEVEM
jgi:raffinose/stachyose/melibiose transport system permease protein